MNAVSAKTFFRIIIFLNIIFQFVIREEEDDLVLNGGLSLSKLSTTSTVRPAAGSGSGSGSGLGSGSISGSGGFQTVTKTTVGGGGGSGTTTVEFVILI